MHGVCNEVEPTNFIYVLDIVISLMGTSAAQFSPQQNYRVYALLWGIHFLLGHAKWPPLPDCIQYDSPLAESNLIKYANTLTPEHNWLRI